MARINSPSFVSYLSLKFMIIITANNQVFGFQSFFRGGIMPRQGFLGENSEARRFSS